jgi:hypothetical protein
MLLGEFVSLVAVRLEPEEIFRNNPARMLIA